MPVIYTATATGRCWKQHTCSACACVYRYRMERTASSSSGQSGNAREAAVNNLSRELATGIECRGCPQCGLMQPDMVAKSKVFWHTATWICSGLMLGMLALAASRPEGLQIEKAAICSAVIAGIAALIYLFVAVHNPNENREANRKKTEAGINAGNVEIARPGVTDNLAPVPANLTLFHYLALLAVLAAPAAYFAPVLIGASNGTQANQDMSPSVVSPGETVTLYLKKSNVESYKGLWRGQPTVQVVNAGELGVLPTLQAGSGNDTWGPFPANARIKESNSHANLFVKMTIPDHLDLVGKTLNLKVSLVVTFPSTSQGKIVEANTITINRDVTVAVSSAKAATAFREAWSLGSMGGLIGSLAGGFILMMLARSLRASANTSEVIPLNAAPPPYSAPPPAAINNDEAMQEAKRRWFSQR